MNSTETNGSGANLDPEDNPLKIRMSDEEVATFLGSHSAKPNDLIETPDGRTIWVGHDDDFYDIGDGGSLPSSLSEDGDVIEKELRIKPGEEYRVRFLPSLAADLATRRVACHYWIGNAGNVAGDYIPKFRLICPQGTSKQKLVDGNQPCPICEVAHDLLLNDPGDYIGCRLTARLECVMPALLLARRITGDESWQSTLSGTLKPVLLVIDRQVRNDLTQIAEEAQGHGTKDVHVAEVLNGLGDLRTGTTFLLKRLVDYQSSLQIEQVGPLGSEEDIRNLERRLRLAPLANMQVAARSATCLETLAQTLRVMGLNTPPLTSPSAEDLQQIFAPHKVAFVPHAWGTKQPPVKGYLDLAQAWMSDLG